MRDYLTPLLQFQRFFLPAIVALALWATWRTVRHRDRAVGLALYLGLVIVVDGFLNTGIFIPGIEKGSIRYSEVCAAFLLINRPPAAPRHPSYGTVRFFVGLYFVLLLVSAFRSDPMMVGVFEFRRLIVPQVIAFAIAMRGMESPEEFRRFFLCLMALSLILGLFIFWDLFFDRWLLSSDMLNKPEYWLNRRHGRYGSFFLNPNYLGAFTVLIFPAAFVWTLSEKVPWARVFATSGLLSLAFCLVETQSRGPLLAFGIVLLLMLLGPAGEMSRTRRLRLFLPFVAVFTLLMPGFFEHAAGRFGSLQEEMSTESARTRQTTWLYTRRAIADHALAGIGFGEQQFLNTMEEYGFEQEYGEVSLDNPHNSYLQMTVYAGVGALLAFVAANLVLLFRTAQSILWGLATRQSHMAFGLAVGIAGFLAVIYPDMHMFTQTVAPVYWVFFGLLLPLATPVSQPTPAVKRYEDSRSYVGNPGQRLAGQPPSVPSRYRRDGPRAAAAGAHLPGEGRTPPPAGPSPRRGASPQQAPVQPASVPRSLGIRGEDDREEPLPGRRSGRVLTPGADARRWRH